MCVFVHFGRAFGFLLHGRSSKRSSLFINVSCALARCSEQTCVAFEFLLSLLVTSELHGGTMRWECGMKQPEQDGRPAVAACCMLHALPPRSASSPRSADMKLGNVLGMSKPEVQLFHK